MPKPIVNLAGEEEVKTRYRAASRSKLPMTSAAMPDHDTFEMVNRKMARAIELKCNMERDKEELDRITDELAAVCQALDMAGFRHGLNGFEYYGWSSRSTLSKELLLEQGVSAEIIDKAMKSGKPFQNTRIVRFDLE